MGKMWESPNKCFLDYFPPAIVEENQKRKKCPELRERSEGGANITQTVKYNM